MILYISPPLLPKSDNQLGLLVWVSPLWPFDPLIITQLCYFQGMLWSFVIYLIKVFNKSVPFALLSVCWITYSVGSDSCENMDHMYGGWVSLHSTPTCGPFLCLFQTPRKSAGLWSQLSFHKLMLRKKDFLESQPPTFIGIIWAIQSNIIGKV